MLTIQALQDTAAAYDQEFQVHNARIYEDGFVSCEEAAEGTHTYQQMRVQVLRRHRHLRQRILRLFHYGRHHPAAQARLTDALAPCYQALSAYDTLLNDSRVMLKIFADVLRDCDPAADSASETPA